MITKVCDTGVLEATKISCNPNATTELCPNTRLNCTCTGTGIAVRWTTNKTGVFNPPTGASFSTALGDDVGASQTAGGFTIAFVNASMSNFISSLQVSGGDVTGVQVSCSIDGGVPDTITPQLAGKVNVHAHVISVTIMAHVCQEFNLKGGTQLESKVTF